MNTHIMIHELRNRRMGDGITVCPMLWDSLPSGYLHTVPAADSDIQA